MLNAVAALAEAAGESILEVYHRDEGFDVSAKADESPLTAADMAAHHVIEAGLKKLTPEIPVLSEESQIHPYSQRQLWQRYWLVDPLDGTRGFVRRNDEFTVNIALIEDGRPVLGVVYLPVEAVCYLAAVGCGCFRREGAIGQKMPGQQMSAQQISVRSIDPEVAGTTVTIAASKKRGKAYTDGLIRRAQARGLCVETLSMGSSKKICLVAEGLVDLYPQLEPTSEWDTAAAQVVLEMAGGALVDQQLRPLQYNSKESLANPGFFAVGGNPASWGWLLQG